MFGSGEKELSGMQNLELVEIPKGVPTGAQTGKMEQRERVG